VRLCTLETRSNLGRQFRLGLILSDNILDLNLATAWRLRVEGCNLAREVADALVPPRMLGFIQGGGRSLEEAHLTFDRWSEDRPEVGPDDETLLYPRDEVRLVTPLPDPPSLRDFYSFEDNVRAGFSAGCEPLPREWYEAPIYHRCATHNLLGSEADVEWPSFTGKFDYELELAAVIGRRGRNVPATAAGDWIFGYTIMNDFTARDVEAKEMKLRLGPAKSKGWATALGPWIVTPDEIPDARKLTMTARVNGELRSSSSAIDMRWSFEQMIEYLSLDDDVFPGDVIASGAVGGGSGRDLDRWVRPGDLMELEIEHIGVLRNRVVKPPPA
jgi:2-keto-4-pentenoate hydratase/2-oxohepta-3-ene-1,7-dioic acid hydratase in catechol pathway